MQLFVLLPPALQEPELLVRSSGAVLAVLGVLRSRYKLNSDALLQVRDQPGGPVVTFLLLSDSMLHARAAGDANC